MPAYNFQTRFAPDVESGRKGCTIRRRRKILTKVGDKLLLYTGQRTNKCRLLREAICQSVTTIEIYHDEVWIEQRQLTSHELEQLAAKDGFRSSEEFLKFFRRTYDLSADNPLLDFEIIQWN